MLTKKECIKELDGLRILERAENFEKWGGQVAPQIKCDVIEQLINEHFELLEKYQNLQDENARLNFNKFGDNFELLKKYQNLQDENARLRFDKIVDNIQDMNYKLWLENPPLTLDEIENMEFVPIWDNKIKEWVLLRWASNGKLTFDLFGSDADYYIKFEENRYFRKQVEEQSNEETSGS